MLMAEYAMETKYAVGERSNYLKRREATGACTMHRGENLRRRWPRCLTGSTCDWSMYHYQRITLGIDMSLV